MNLSARLTSRRRALSLVILLVVTALLFGLPAYAGWRHVDETSSRLNAGLEQLDRLRAIAAAMPQLRDLQDELENDRRLAQRTYPPVSDAQAAAALQSLVQSLVADGGAEVRSIQALPAVDDGPLLRVGVRTIVTADSNSLNRFLDATRSAQPALIVGPADIRVSGQSRRSSADDVAPTLQGSFDVFAFVRKD